VTYFSRNGICQADPELANSNKSFPNGKKIYVPPHAISEDQATSHFLDIAKFCYLNREFPLGAPSVLFER
jgi:hypothetical protein